MNQQTPSRRIAYVVPSPMDRDEAGAAEVARRQTKLRGWAFPGTEVDVRTVNRGPRSIESAYEEYLAIPAAAEEMRRVEAEGYDAAIIGCFGDPGLDGLREVCDIFVTGPASASIATATMLGHRFSIVTVAPSIVPALRRLVWETGSSEALASVRSISIPVLSLGQDRDSTLQALHAEARLAMDQDGADVVVLGCMSMGFLDAAEELTEELGIPVINPAHAALKAAESTVAQRLTHSRSAYMTPPKVAAGMRYDDLIVQSAGP